VPVEESTHRRLTLLADGDELATALLESGIERTPDGPDFARLRFRDSGGCSMLDGQGLCRVHAGFGHAELFAVCATYPRYANEIDDDVELFGTLACPEVTRLALLAADGFELALSTVEATPRLARNRFRTASPYFMPFKQLRSAFIQLLSEPAYALAEKLFVMLWLADKLKPVLYEGCASVPPLDLEKALSALADPGVLGALSSSFRGLMLEGTLPISVIVATLRPPGEPRPGAQTTRFEGIWHEVEARYGAAVARGHAPSDAELRDVWTSYRATCARLPASARERIDVCLTRYGVNHLLTTPHMLSANLFQYAYDLVLRLACLRFLLNSRLADFCGSQRELDASIVEVVYSFVRTIENADLPSELRKTLREQGLDGFAHAVCFLSI